MVRPTFCFLRFVGHMARDVDSFSLYQFSKCMFRTFLFCLCRTQVPLPLNCSLFTSLPILRMAQDPTPSDNGTYIVVVAQVRMHIISALLYNF